MRGTRRPSNVPAPRVVGMESITRRTMLLGMPALAVAPVAVADPEPPRAAWRLRQDPTLVQEIVAAAHVDEAKVRALLDAHPRLVHAAWDWGFGDWETPLGAAAHTGRRAIAELLLERGARPDLFAAAMLGWTPVVRAFVAVRPGVQRTLGPHGITLLAHARAGGDAAAETLALLEVLGDADVGLPTIPIAAESTARYLGTYAAANVGLRVAIRTNSRGQLVADLEAPGEVPVSRPIHACAVDEFFPAGVPSTRLRFAGEGDRADALVLTIHADEIRAQRAEH